MNKPVAYLHKDGSLIKVDQRYEVIDPDFIPLYTHPVKEEHFEDEPQAEELHEILQSHNEPLNYEVTHPRWSKEKEIFGSWQYPQKTYEDGIEECAKRAEAYSYMSPNFTALAEELRAILRKAQEPLGSKFEKVLHNNLWEMLEEDNGKAQEK